MTRARAAAGLAALVLLAVLPAVPAGADVDALQAADTVEAALAWSRHGVPDGERVDTVLVARSDRFPEALASGGVQGLLDAPLLLTPGGSLDGRVAEEVQRLGAQEAVLLGGEAALSSEVEEDLEALGLTVTRVSGDTRITTAAVLARRFFPHPEQVVVVRAFGDQEDETRAFADSLAAGMFAARLGAPVLLTETEHLSDAVYEYLAEARPEAVHVVGGNGAVGPTAREQIQQATGRRPEVVNGPNRFWTAWRVGQRSGELVTHDGLRPVIVDGGSPLAWAAGLPAAGHVEQGAILLADGPRLPDETLFELFVRPEHTVADVLCAPFTAAIACDRADQVAEARDDIGVLGRFDPRPDLSMIGLVRLREHSAACVRNVEAPEGRTLDFHQGSAAGPLVLQWMDRAELARNGQDPLVLCRFDVPPAALDTLFARPGDHVAVVRESPVPRRQGIDLVDLVSYPLEPGRAERQPS